MNQFWSFGSSALGHLFASGRLRAGVQVQKALQEQEVIAYQQTVLKGLQEVENALVASEKEQAHRQAQQQARGRPHGDAFGGAFGEDRGAVDRLARHGKKRKSP